MTLINPVIADMFTREIRDQARAAGPVPAFKTDELALWHADQTASGCPRARRPQTLRIGPFTYWLRREAQPYA